MTQQYLTVEEVSKFLRVSTPTVRQLIESGELKAVRVGRQYRIAREDLDDYIRRHS